MQKKIDKDFSLESVDTQQKKGFWQMLTIMLGFTFFSASMWAGGTLGVGLSLHDFITSVFIGNFILGVYTGFLALIAARSGLSIHLLSRYSFGEKGSFLPSIILILTQIGWFGVGVAMFAIPTSLVLIKLPALSGSWLLEGNTISINADAVQIPIHLLYTLIAISGLLMTSTVYWGIRALAIISIVAVPAIIVLGSYSAIKAMFFDSVDGGKIGLEIIKTYHPLVENKLSLINAITITIGSFIAGGTCTPDFTRFSKNSKIAVSTTVLAFFLGNTLMFIFGATGAMVYKQSDISLVLNLQGLLLPAIVLLGLNIWTTNNNALYTSGLGLSNLTKLPQRYLSICAGILGTILSVWLYNNFCDWLNMLNTVIPPIGAILIVDYFIINHAKYLPLSKKVFNAVNMSAIFSWFLGSLVALIGLQKIPFLHSELLSKGLPAINGMFISGISYYLFRWRLWR